MVGELLRFDSASRRAHSVESRSNAEADDGTFRRLWTAPGRPGLRFLTPICNAVTK